MEEILSSIRRIIADEASEEEGQDTVGTKPEGLDRDADDDVLELTDVVREDSEDGEVIELDRALAQAPSIEGPRLEAVPDEPDRDELDQDPWHQEEADGADEPAAAQAAPPAAGDPAGTEAGHQPAHASMDIEDDQMEDHRTAMQKNNGTESLVSDRAAGAAEGALAKLSQAVQRTPPEVAIADDSGRTVEQFFEDMMRPMLREWLDENLPPLIERIVEKEIQKIVRRAELG
jgi:cell pole-organizing protein PopZ